MRGELEPGFDRGPDRLILSAFGISLRLEEPEVAAAKGRQFIFAWLCIKEKRLLQEIKLYSKLSPV